MNYHFPTGFMEAVQGVERKRYERLQKGRAWLHAASPPEYFNAILRDRVELLNAQYGFNAPEHEDWVDPSVLYFMARGKDESDVSSFGRPLNSWILKNPVDFLPSIEEIKELAHCMHTGLVRSADKTLSAPSADQLHENFIETACLQLRDTFVVLSYWREAGQPREQSFRFPTLTRKDIKKVLDSQNRNMDNASRRLHIISKASYPQFMLDRYRANLAQDQQIFGQIKELLRRA